MSYGTTTQTQNSILRISDEKTLQLLDLYEKEECLWNTHSPEYKSRQKRQIATERIAEKLNIKYFEARHVVIKFKNLRNSYCQELKKISTSVNLGLNEDEAYKPKVFWFSKMDSFLKPHLQPARGSFPTLHVNEVDVENTIKIEIQDEESESVEPSEDSLAGYPVIEQCGSMHSDDYENSETGKKRRMSSQAQASQPSWSKRVRRDALYQMIRNIHNKIDAMAEAKNEDYYDNFGKYIASLLRSMPKEKAMMLQPKVISLIVTGSGLGEGSVSQSDGNDL